MTQTASFVTLGTTLLNLLGSSSGFVVGYSVGSATPGVPSSLYARTTIASEGDISTTDTDDDVDGASTLTLLSNVHVNVVDPAHAYPFYRDLLGMELAPRNDDDKDDPLSVLSCGACQFHLHRVSTDEEATTLPGTVGLSYASLAPLKERLQALGDNSDDSFLKEGEVTADGDCVRLVDRHDNVFYAREGSSPPPVHTTNSDCVGVSYVEFRVPPKTAVRIAQFYECALDATTSTVETADGETVAIVAVGNICETTGRADQTLLFKETEGTIPPRPGQDDKTVVTLYVGRNAQDFEVAFQNCDVAGVVCVNPRFRDKAPNLTGAKLYKQFRFKDILDLKTGKKLFRLEHEVRSVEHDAWPGKKQ